MDEDRSELEAWVQAALDSITPGQFLLLEYLTGDALPVEPYAQAALDPGGWYCEIVSAHHLPGHLRRLDELALVRDSWRAPDSGTDNWWQSDVTLNAAARLLVDALWFARDCTDPDLYAISIGTFPSGPRGGEPLPLSEWTDLVIAA